MTKKSFFVFILFLFIIPIQLSLLFSKDGNGGSVAGIGMSQQQEVFNSASIGEFHFTLFGYTSPSAEVSLNGQGIADETSADSTGYFEFENRFSPFSSREACLSSKDQFGRVSSPVCLSPFPVNYNVSIGPVIIPPTISLDKSNYFTNDEILLTGQTIPDTDINLSMFTQPSTFKLLNPFPFLSSNFSLIRPVEAFSIPQLIAKSDYKGNFSIFLPSSQAQNYRIFTQVDYQDNPSTNSLAITVKVLPVWMIVIKFFLFLFSLIKPRLLEILILTEIIYIIYVIKSHIQSKAIVLYERHLPAIEESHLPEVEEEKPLIKY